MMLTLTLCPGGGRVVNVSSCAHFMGSWFDWSDPHLKTFYSPEQAYGNSKAAQGTCDWSLYFSAEL